MRCRRKTPSLFKCWPDSRSICPGHIRSLKLETASSIRSSGCPRTESERPTSCWPTPQYLRRCLAAWNPWRTFGKTWHRSRSQAGRRPNSAHVTLAPNLSGIKNRRLLLPLSEPHKDIDKPSEGELTIARGEFEELLWLSTFLYVLQFIAGLDTALGGPQNLYYETQVLVIPERPMPSIGCCRIPPYCRSSIHCVCPPLWHLSVIPRWFASETHPPQGLSADEGLNIDAPL